VIGGEGGRGVRALLPVRLTVSSHARRRRLLEVVVKDREQTPTRGEFDRPAQKGARSDKTLH
jgi:hypothetical protein